MQEEINKAIEVLESGGLLLYPTETVWGLGCDASNEQAVDRLLDLKGRGQAQGLIVLLGSDVQLEQHVENIPEVAWDIIDGSDKPITIIYDSVKGIASNVSAADGSAAIRVTRDEFCSRLVQKFRKPLVSTSANTSGQMHADLYENLEPRILEGVDYVVNLKRNERLMGKPSSVVKLASNGEIKIIRK